MDATPAAAKLDRMLQVQHLVVDDVLHGVTRNSGLVKDPAYHDRIVSGIIMAKAVAGMVPAPCHPWAAQETKEKTPVQVLKDGIKVIGSALRAFDLLAASYLAHQMGFRHQ